MNIVLLSGGSGKRLWPLSNDVRSKQFIKLFKNSDGKYESMLERMYRGIKNVCSDANITIATSNTQVSSIYNQIGDSVGISLEPDRRDTFPAIALACSYLHDVKNIGLDETIIVCPIDPYVENDYFEALKELYELASTNDSNLTLMGIKPTYPSEKYGYIMPKTNDKVSEVEKFCEKPNIDLAKEYIEQGALWNSGIFAFKLSYLLDIAHKLIDFKDYQDLFDKYSTVEKISFDYAVVEKEEKISSMIFSGMWKDLGTWNTLAESIDDNIIGKAILSEDSVNTHIINELNIPILGAGLEDIIIAASSDGILVSNKEKSSYIKKYVEEISDEARFQEKSWGTYRVIDVQTESLTVLATLNSGSRMKYHLHENRDEVWTIISGNGKVILDGKEMPVKAGDVIEIKRNVKHTIIADNELKIIEVQLGKDINVLDKKIYDEEI